MISIGREGAINIEPLKQIFDSLLHYWDYKAFDQQLLTLSLQHQAQFQYNQIRYEF